MPTFMSKKNFLTWLELHETAAVHFEENRNPRNANEFAKMVQDNISPADYRDALKEVRDEEVPFLLTPLGSINGKVIFSHSCRIDRKTRFSPEGTDTIWALTGRDDKTSAVCFGKGKDAVQVRVPKGAELEKAADAAAFKATKATGNKGEEKHLNPLPPIPAILFAPLSNCKDQSPEALGWHALKFAKDLDIEITETSESRSNKKTMAKAFHYVAQHYWAMANNKIPTLDPIALTDSNAEAFVEEMESRYLAPPKPSNESSEAALKIAAETAESNRMLREEIQSRRSPKKSTSETSSALKKFNSWPDHSKRAVLAMTAKKEIRNTDGDICELQRREEPTANLLAIINAGGVTPGKATLVNALDVEHNVDIDPCDATILSLQQGTFTTTINECPSKVNLFCLGRVAVNDKRYESVETIEHETAKNLQKSEGQGWSDEVCVKSSKMHLSLPGSPDTGSRLLSNAIAFWSHILQDGGEVSDIVSYLLERQNFVDSNFRLFERMQHADSSFCTEYLELVQCGINQYMRRCGSVEIGKPPSTQPLDSIANFEETFLASGGKVWNKVKLPRYLLNALPQGKRPTSHDRDDPDDSPNNRSKKKTKVAKDRGNRVTNKNVASASSTLAKKYWPKFLQQAQEKASDYFDSMCLNYHVRGTCHDKCGRVDTHKKLSETDYADFWEVMTPLCKEAAK